MKNKRPQGGYVLLVTMMLLLLLTTTAALVFEQSNSGVEISAALKTQSIAQARASMGVMQMRAQSLTQVASMLSLPVCTKADAEANLLPACRLVLQKGADANGLVNFVTNPTTGSNQLDEGAGQQYRVFLYNQGPGTGTNGSYYIVSTGFYGYPGSPNMKESQIVVETTLPSGVKDKPCESGYGGTC